MLIASTQDPQKPAVSLGSVVWSAVPANPGQPGSSGVKAEIDVTELTMHATMTLRRNVDATLPASHTIDLRLAFDEGSSIGSVKDIGVPQMRRDDPPQVVPLAGVRVMINESYFLIGLNRADADIQRNMASISDGGWFDFPMLLNDGRIAKLTFEKGADGEKIIANAIAPRFKAGDFNGGVTRGVDDIITTLTTDSAEWTPKPRDTRSEQEATLFDAIAPFLIFLFIMFVLSRVSRRGGGNVVFIPMGGGGFGRGGGFGGGGFGGGGFGGGGGFSGGGGSSGGGGASGGW